MEIPTDTHLLARIEKFIERHDIPPSRFGREAMGDGALIPQLKEGRSLSLRNADRVLRYMDGYVSTTNRAA
jgi:hypothetical protein